MRLYLIQFAALVFLVAFPLVAPAPTPHLDLPESGLVFTVLPAGSTALQWDGARIARLLPDGTRRFLSDGFHSAADPAISFDAKRLLFAAKRQPGEPWQIFESGVDGSDIQQLTRMEQDCRRPVYQSRFFTLDAPTPWDQVAFVAGGQLYTVPLEDARAGTGRAERITFFRGESVDPVVAPDGRLLFSYRDSAGLLFRLFGVNLDGTDYALFNGESRRDLRHAATVNDERMVVVEAGAGDPWGSGRLSTINLWRPQQSLKQSRLDPALRFHSPDGLPDGSIVAAVLQQGSFALVRVNQAMDSVSPLLADPGQHLLQPRAIFPRQPPDGRGSVVDPSEDWALLYCLNVYTNDPADGPTLKAGAVARVRVLEYATSGEAALGDAPVETDGSFHLRVPANRPIRLELLDGDGTLLRRGAWIYARNKEARGCIGCHEDPELSPVNRVPIAVTKPVVDLTLPRTRPAKGGAQ